jgi:hypothetical protein
MILSPNTLMTEAKVAEGQHTTVTANDIITVAGLRKVERVCATLEDDPVAGAQFVTAVPIANSNTFRIKTWKATATADTAQIAATTFTKKVNWIAFGS